VILSSSVVNYFIGIYKEITRREVNATALIGIVRRHLDLIFQLTKLKQVSFVITVISNQVQTIRYTGITLRLN